MTTNVSTQTSAIAKIVGFILSLLLILSGIMMLRAQYLGSGMLVLILGITAFLAVSCVLKKSPLDQETLVFLKPYRVLIVCWAIAPVLMIWILYRIAPAKPLAALIPTWVLWLVSLLLLILGALSLQPKFYSKAKLKTGWQTHRREIIFVTLILVAGFMARAQALSVHPYPWSGDEASVGIEARRILNGEVREMFATGWSGQPYWSFVPTTISIALLGDTINALRVVSVTVGTLTILTLYLFCRELFSVRVAMIAAIFMVAFPYHLQFSRIGVSNIFDGLNVTLSLWLAYRAITKHQLLDYTLAGICAGFALYTYVGSRLVLLMVIGVFLYAVIIKRGYLRGQWMKITAFGCSMTLTIAPISYYFIQHPDNFMTRIGQEGILLNGWLTAEAERAGTNILGVLLGQFSKSTLVFIAESASGNFFNSPEPYLTLLGSMLFIIGMIHAFFYIKELRYIFLLGWFWSVVLFGGILTSNPPANTRMLMSAPAIAAFLAIGLDQINETFRYLRVPAAWINALTGIILLVLTFQGYTFYFGDYRTGNYMQDANSELGMEAGLALEQMGVEYRYYLIGAPRVFVNFPTTEYLIPDHTRMDLQPDMIDDLEIFADQPAIFIAIPENKTALDRIRARFPGGQWNTVYRKTKPEVLYYSYTFSH